MVAIQKTVWEAGKGACEKRATQIASKFSACLGKLCQLKALAVLVFCLGSLDS